MKKRKIVSTLDKDGVLHGRVESLRTGVYAGDLRYSFRFKSKEEQNIYMHKALASTYPDISLKALEFGDLEPKNDSVSYFYEYIARNTVTFSGRTAIFTLNIPDDIPPSSFPVEEERKYPVDMHEAWYDVSTQMMEGELVYPEEWKPADLPAAVELDTPYGTYLLEFGLKGNGIFYKREVRFEFNRLLPVGEYARLTDFLKQVSKSDAVQLVFFTD